MSSDLSSQQIIINQIKEIINKLKSYHNSTKLTSESPPIGTVCGLHVLGSNKDLKLLLSAEKSLLEYELRQSMELNQKHRYEKESVKRGSEKLKDKQIVKRFKNRVYAKNSMDRLGDDLTEEVIQPLSLEDKIRLECVSEEWKRYVFQKQLKLNINIKVNNDNHNPNRHIIESVLKKCQNINNVIIPEQINSSVLSLIGQYCLHFKSLSYLKNCRNDENYLSFFRINGYKLEKLKIDSDDNELELILSQCPNLKKIFCQGFHILREKDKVFVSKLEMFDDLIEIFRKC